MTLFIRRYVALAWWRALPTVVYGTLRNMTPGAT